MQRIRFFLIFVIIAILGVGIVTAQAEEMQPWQTADSLQDTLFLAQSALLAGDAPAAAEHIAAAQAIAAAWDDLPPASRERLDEAMMMAATAVAEENLNALAVAKGQAQGAIYGGSYLRTRQAIEMGDTPAAQQWLLVRDFRPSTRFSRPGADATLAVRQLTAENLQEIVARLDADLLDTYQARLSEHLATAVDTNIVPNRRAEAAGLAAAYWPIIAPAYGEQQGEQAANRVANQFGDMVTALLAGDETAVASLATDLQTTLQSFRAAPLSPSEEARRAGQLMRFLALVPIEYERGVQGTTVMVDLEIQEAVTFMQGAQAAFADLRLSLDGLDAAKTADLAQQFSTITTHLNDANRRENVVPVDQMVTAVTQLMTELEQLFPSAWLENNANADFDVLASVLDQMETAVKAGDYALAESARLEAYAIFDFGPEPRLLAFAPPLVAEVDGLFWQGYSGQAGLAQAIALKAEPGTISTIRQQLDAALAQAQLTLGDLPSAPGAIITNAAIIVFREGLESVVILAALMASMVGAYAHYRRPMALGAILSLVATAVTWILAQRILSSLTRYGERLEAVVSLIAIGILLLITNWFFHKTYWKDWMAGFHAQKRQLLSRETGQFVGLLLLGFTSMYREGFETVLFLQALTLEAGTAVVLQGVAFGVVAVLVVGLITFRLQARLPYKQMLVWTGVLIGLVLVTMVGKTVHVMQAVSWLPITPIQGLTLPYWAGLWLGLFATWQGIVAQAGAAVFVVGSYYLAEFIQSRNRQQLRQKTGAQPAIKPSKS
ncbi:MAG: FTR1 family protein [Ardenticatenaceae bacterium]|nr:FTR1 family protein [Ardenticatenaceae bacterium]